MNLVLTKEQEKEIYAQIYMAEDNDGKYNGMSYEQGIIDALNWIINGDLNELLYE